MILLVGLGNPGKSYSKNRHNIGFMAVSEIARRHNFSPFKARFNAEIAEGMLGNEKVLILMPTTYMNRSGQSVGEAMRYYSLTPDDIIVMHDELALEAGKIRVKQGGGHAGNNGIRDIIAHIGEDFHRIRLGIGHPGDKDKVSQHVLSDFSKADKEWLEPLLETVADNSDLLAQKDWSRFTTKIATILRPNAKSAKPETPDIEPSEPNNKDK